MSPEKPGTRARLALLLRLGAIAAFVLWFYSPYLGPGIPPGDFPSDTMVKEVHRDLVGSPVDGRGWHPFLSWNPLLMCGRPAFEFPGPFTLFEIPFRGLGPVDRLKALVVLFHVLSGLTMYALLAGIGAGSNAALFGGAVYPVMASHISRSAVHGHIHLPMFWAILPLLALAFFRLRAGDARGTVLLGLALALSLLRDSQRTVLTCVLIGVLVLAWLAWELVRSIGGRGARVPKRAAWLLLLFLAAFTLAVVVESFEVVNRFVGDPYRGGWIADEQARWYSHWSVDNLYSYMDWDMRFATWINPHVKSIGPSMSRYLGVSLLAIILVAIVMRAVAPGQRARFTAALLLLGLAVWLSFGSKPLWGSTSERWKAILEAPGLTSGAKSCLVALAVGFLALVVWLVARALRPRRLRYPLALVATSAALALFLGTAPLGPLRRMLFVLRDLRNPDWIQLAVASFAVAFAAAIAAAGLARRTGDWDRIVFALLLGLAVLDVWAYRPHLTKTQARREARADIENANRFIAKDPQWCRVMGTMRYSNMTDLGYIWHRKPLAWDFRSYSAPRRTLKFFTTLFEMINRRDRLDLLPSMAGIAGVKYLVEQRLYMPSGIPEVPGLEPRLTNDFVEVLENLAWRPYLQAYPEAAVLMGNLHASGVKLTAELARKNVGVLAIEAPDQRDLLDGRRKVFIDPEDVSGTPEVPAEVLRIGTDPSPFVETRGFTVEPSLSSTRPAPEQILVHVSSKAPLVLVVSESYHPWWRASVDGKPATLYPGGFAFLGLPLDAGDHDIDLRFVRPASIAFWGYVGLAALALSLAFLWRTRGRRAEGDTLIPGA